MWGTSRSKECQRTKLSHCHEILIYYYNFVRGVKSSLAQLYKKWNNVASKKIKIQRKKEHFIKYVVFWPGKTKSVHWYWTLTHPPPIILSLWYYSTHIVHLKLIKDFSSSDANRVALLCYRLCHIAHWYYYAGLQQGTIFHGERSQEKSASDGQFTANLPVIQWSNTWTNIGRPSNCNLFFQI